MPEGIGPLSRCIYESMALRYRRTLDELHEISGEKITSLRVMGGGCRNEFLNQMLADATGIPIVAGPDEAACVGSVIMQMLADGQIKTLSEGWEIAERSFCSKRYEPRLNPEWEKYYQFYKGMQ